MCVHAKQERNEQVMCVPKGFKGLLTDPVVGSGIDQKHTEKHNVSSDTTGLSVMNLQRNLRSYLCSLNVEEAVRMLILNESMQLLNLLNVMCGSMKNRKEKHGIGDLSMEPLRFIER
jgi:hypothetical protein